MPISIRPTRRPLPLLYCVVYRTGDIENFAWYRSEAMTADEAVDLRTEMENVGHKAMIANHAQSVAIGLPEGYNA